MGYDVGLPLKEVHTTMKYALRTLLALAILPALSFAVSVDVNNTGGKLTGSTAGLILTGSEFVSVSGNFGVIAGNLGTVTFSTGSLMAGSLADGGNFNGGGMFVITGDGLDGVHNGVIFSGTFVGEEQWRLFTLPNGTHDYTLTGVLSGTTFNGAPVVAETVQLTINTGFNLFNGHNGIKLSSGDTSLSGNVRVLNTPEPGSFGLLGFVLTLAGTARHWRIKRT